MLAKKCDEFCVNFCVDRSRRMLRQDAMAYGPKETLIYSKPFGLSLSKPLKVWGLPFDKLRANG